MTHTQKSPINDPSYGRTVDARGRSVTLLDPYTMNLLRQHKVIDAEALHDIAKGVGSGLVKGTRALFIMSLICQVAVGIAVLDYLIQFVMHKIAISVITEKIGIFIPALTGPILIWLGARNNRLKRTKLVMLEHKRCPHCGYDLRLLPVDACDGVTVCPECGCAWMLSSTAMTAT